MKRIYSLLICILPLFAMAQPTITQSDLPIVGTTWQLGIDPTYSAPIQPGGAGATWNYSSLLNTITDSLAFQASSGSAYPFLFPASNIASLNTASGIWSYWMTDFTGMYFNGSSSTGVTTDSMNPALLFMPVPFTYLGTTSSSSTVQRDSSDGISCITLYHVVNSSFTADGWGTLTTPAGTFTDVLRVAITETVIDSSHTDFLCFGFFITSGPVSTTQVMRYRYFAAGSTYSYLLGINADSLGTTSTSSEYLLNPLSVSVNNLQAANQLISLYPNPANHVVHVNLAGGNNASSELRIYDTMSRTVYSRNTTGLSVFDIAADKLESGVYFYSLISEKGTESGKFTVVH